MTHTELRDILTAAGVRKSEAVELFRVSRSTLDRWLKEDANPKQQMTYNLAVKFANYLADGVLQGLLPTGPDIVGKDRIHAIKTAIRTVAANQKG